MEAPKQLLTFEGDWNGAVSVECSRQQACYFAGRIMSMQPPDAVDDDVRDMLGELANMIGGNIKSMIASDSQLSMPLVIDGSRRGLRLCGTAIEKEIGFKFTEGDFLVTIARKSA